MKHSKTFYKCLFRARSHRTFIVPTRAVGRLCISMGFLLQKSISLGASLLRYVPWICFVTSLHSLARILSPREAGHGLGTVCETVVREAITTH